MESDMFMVEDEVKNEEMLMYLDEVTGECKITAGVESATDESVLMVEYVGEDDDGDDGNAVAEGVEAKHTLYSRQDDEGNEIYCCLQCNEEYASIDEFTLAHQSDDSGAIMESQWEAVGDELPVEEAEENELAEAETDIVKNTWPAVPIDGLLPDDIVQHIKDELNETDKYYCCECHTVFSDMESAEQHDCPGVVPEENDEESNGEIGGVTVAHNENAEEAEAQEEAQNSPAASPKTFKCEMCSRTFSTVNALCSHSRTHKFKLADQKDLPVINCEICNTNFSSEKNLKFHMRMHISRPMKSIQDALPAGAKVQYNECNQFYCELCDKSFDQNLLVVHKNMHQQLQEYRCGICNRQFENASTYELHLKLHEDKQRRLKEDRPVSKSKHLNSGGKISFPCQYCGHEFARPYEKVKHERVHTGEKPYECEVCGKTFRVTYSLTLHLRSHTNIRPYVCATCNKRFKSQPVYTHHLKTHLTERSYKCDQCPKTFRTSVQLCGHKNSHKKPFNCPECNRPFAALYAVRVHMATHAKNNNRAVASKAPELAKHHCSYCGAAYSRRFALRLHLKEQHNIDLIKTAEESTALEEKASTSKMYGKALRTKIPDLLPEEEQVLMDALQAEDPIDDDDDWLPA